MKYYIADYHFGHANVLGFDHRPFNDVQEMEEVLVANWNAAVKPGDIVYILGDFCWSKKPEEWIRILSRLPGDKVLIRGNHDPEKYTPELREQFVDIKDYMEIEETNNRKAILSHYPILFYKNAARERHYMLRGHVHISPENDLLEQWTAELKTARMNPDSNIVNRAQIYNVGCMMPWMAYTPRTLDEIIQGHAAYMGQA